MDTAEFSDYGRHLQKAPNVQQSLLLQQSSYIKGSRILCGGYSSDLCLMCFVEGSFAFLFSKDLILRFIIFFTLEELGRLFNLLCFVQQWSLSLMHNFEKCVVKRNKPLDFGPAQRRLIRPDSTL